ncbi:MAG: winged helix-turn-helix transcriptional regulator [bacterium]|nr:winged helix-turn-helix transcriptional regulator [bacterium]
MDDDHKELLEARANVFKALGHPSRLAIVDALAGGERCVCELNESVDADLSTVSRHLAVLKNVGILSSEKCGNQVFYKLECPCVASFYGCVESVIRGTGQPLELENLQ